MIRENVRSVFHELDVSDPSSVNGRAHAYYMDLIPYYSHEPVQIAYLDPMRAYRYGRTWLDNSSSASGYELVPAWTMVRYLVDHVIEHTDAYKALDDDGAREARWKAKFHIE